MQEDEAVCWVDASRGVGGLQVGDVASAVHDAVFEEGGSVRLELELRAVVAFEGEGGPVRLPLAKIAEIL